MDVRLTWTDCDEAGDYVVPNVLSPRDQVSRPDNMDETVLHKVATLGPRKLPVGKKSKYPPARQQKSHFPLFPL